MQAQSKLGATHNNRFLCIIPARSGSKRLPNKNIKPLCGKPLLAWSIEAARESKYIDEIVVSTDSKEYAEIAKCFGASVPFLRPKELSLDTTTTFEVLEHCIRFYENLGKWFDYVVLLQPTSPLREAWHIKEACEKLITSGADSVISVCKCEHPPLWSNTLPENEDMSGFIAPEIRNIRSQDLPCYYRLNGAIFIAKTKALLESKDFFTKHTIAYKMDTMYSSDIDSSLDFEFAHFLAKYLQKEARKMRVGGGALTNPATTESVFIFRTFAFGIKKDQKSLLDSKESTDFTAQPPESVYSALFQKNNPQSPYAKIPKEIYNVA